MEPWLWAMQDADEAEGRGDARGALEVVRRRLLDPDGRLFWRPSRVERLRQLVLLGPLVPGWAISRWILAQAMQQLSDTGCGPGSRMARAIKVAADLRGGLGAIPGTDAVSRRIKVADHDWVFRQVQLFELGGLDAFLRDVASPDLIAGADRIRDWARTPMGGFAFVGAGRGSLLWHDLTSSATVTTPDIGTALHLAPGDHVIGRLVPLTDGVIFEGRPLGVTRAIAADVARSPARWLDVLRGSGLVRSGEIRTDVCEDTGLLSDVPMHPTSSTLLVTAEPARAALDLARLTLVEEHQRDTHLLDGCPAGELGGGCPVCSDHGWDAWARVHAALVDADVVEALPDVVGTTDLDVLRGIVDAVAEPAGSWVSRLIGQVEAAA